MTKHFDADETKARLGRIGQDLRLVDNMILALVASRMVLAGRVAWTKSMRRDDEYPNGEPISRPEVERQRLDAIAVRAEEYGVDPNLARTLLSILIDHSCKQQMIRWQSGAYDFGEFSPEELKTNLLELARLAAPTYGNYDAHFPATQAYLKYEQGLLGQEVASLQSRRKALDLGCATGGLTNFLAPHFEQVIGVDLSPEMVAVASGTAESNTSFEVADIESSEFWQTLEPGSFDFVVMGLGTASDIPDIAFVISQIDRVLASGGRFVLSFYNEDGLVHRIGYQPWVSSLAATLDTERNCLDVKVGDRVISVYARPYTQDKVESLFGRHLQVTNYFSYPTLASILPREILESPTLQSLITEVDTQSAGNGSADGAFLLAVGRK